MNISSDFLAVSYDGLVALTDNFSKPGYSYTYYPVNDESDSHFRINEYAKSAFKRDQFGEFIVKDLLVRRKLTVKEHRGWISTQNPLFGFGTKTDDPEYFTHLGGFHMTGSPGDVVETIHDVLTLAKEKEKFYFSFSVCRGSVDWVQSIACEGDAGEWDSAFSHRKMDRKGALTCLRNRLALFNLVSPYLVDSL